MNHRHSDRLYELLPAIYRARDAEQGWPLQALLRVIGEQVDLVEEDIAQLYENWFIETCQDWVVPYIGDLIGYLPVHEAGEPGEVTTAGGRLRNKILIPRRDVANTIGHRRRKGTLSLLEQLAEDVAGWPAHAVEFYKLLGYTQTPGALQLRRGRTVDLRDSEALTRLHGPFDEIARVADVRGVPTSAAPAYNIPAVGLFVWRLRVYPVTRTRACQLTHIGSHLFTFSITGYDTQLYTRPVSQVEAQQTVVSEINFPTPISRFNLRTHLSDYYGEEKSLCIWTGRAVSSPKAKGKHARGVSHTERAGSVQSATIIWEPVDASRIEVVDLTDRQYLPAGDTVAVDPQLGRIAFARMDYPPEGSVRVSYHYAFSADIGGGEYYRALPERTDSQLFRVSKREGDIHSLEEALEQWERWKREHTEEQAYHGIIEIADSSVYTERRLSITLRENEHLCIRAANRTRPVLDGQPDGEEALDVAGTFPLTGTSGSHLTLDGLFITGRGVRITGDLAGVTIRHCTLLPGWGSEHEDEKPSTVEPSLELFNTSARVTIEQSILGSIQVNENEVRDEPVHLSLLDSILDATSDEREALGSPGWPVAHASVTIARSTVLGKVQVHALDLAENSIFTGQVLVARRQTGCTRFCCIPPGSRVPHPYHCQPDLVIRQAEDDLKEREGERVHPVFNSRRYGTPGYCQLASMCAGEITRGADDEAEMGVFHDLFQPQRTANLRARIAEYTPAGMETGIIFVN